MAERGYFSLSVKGLYRDGDKILVVRDNDGRWELPGGGADQGEEDLVEVLRRECREELGVEIEVEDSRPLGAWIAKTDKGYERAMVIYRIKPVSFNYHISEEAEETRMVTKEELNQLNLVPQLEKLKQLL